MYKRQEDGVKTLITDQLEATPRTIDTTVLGTTNVRWVYRYKTTNPVSVRAVSYTHLDVYKRQI